MLKHMESAFVLPPEQRFCSECGKPLEGAIAWLEMSYGGEFSEGNEIPPDESQGFQPFGLTCAKKMLKKHHYRYVA